MNHENTKEQFGIRLQLIEYADATFDVAVGAVYSDHTKWKIANKERFNQEHEALKWAKEHYSASKIIARQIDIH